MFGHRNKISYSYGYCILLYNFFPEKKQVRNCQRHVENRAEIKILITVTAGMSTESVFENLEMFTKRLRVYLKVFAVK